MKLKRSIKGYCFTIILLIIFVGCQNNTTQTKETAQTATADFIKKDEFNTSITSSKCDSTIINNEFSIHALAFDVFKTDTEKIKSLFLDPVVLKKKKQKNNEVGNYFHYEFTDVINKIILYNNKGFYIQEADIKNDKVRLNKKIAIGMNKDVFLKMFSVKAVSCDTISVKDYELTFESVCIFKVAKLPQITLG